MCEFINLYNKGYLWFFDPFLLVFVGGLYGGRDVCSEGEESSCYAGGFRDGSGEGNEKGDWEEHVPEEAVEVTW